MKKYKMHDYQIRFSTWLRKADSMLPQNKTLDWAAARASAKKNAAIFHRPFAVVASIFGAEVVWPEAINKAALHQFRTVCFPSGRVEVVKPGQMIVGGA